MVYKISLSAHTYQGWRGSLTVSTSANPDKHQRRPDDGEIEQTSSEFEGAVSRDWTTSILRDVEPILN